jgi:hypothetical protein
VPPSGRRLAHRGFRPRGLCVASPPGQSGRLASQLTSLTNLDASGLEADGIRRNARAFSLPDRQIDQAGLHSHRLTNLDARRLETPAILEKR